MGEEEEEGRKGKLRGKPFFLRPATVRESYFLLFALLLPYLLLLESRSLSSGVWCSSGCASSPERDRLRYFLSLESFAGVRRLLACLDLYNYQIKSNVILHFNLSSGYFIDLLIFKGKLRF